MTFLIISACLSCWHQTKFFLLCQNINLIVVAAAVVFVDVVVVFDVVVAVAVVVNAAVVAAAVIFDCCKQSLTRL